MGAGIERWQRVLSRRFTLPWGPAPPPGPASTVVSSGAEGIMCASAYVYPSHYMYVYTRVRVLSCMCSCVQVSTSRVYISLCSPRCVSILLHMRAPTWLAQTPHLLVVDVGQDASNDLQQKDDEKQDKVLRGQGFSEAGWATDPPSVPGDAWCPGTTEQSPHPWLPSGYRERAQAAGGG